MQKRIESVRESEIKFKENESDLLYSEFSDKFQGGFSRKPNYNNFDSEDDFLSEEIDRMSNSEEDFKNEKKLNNGLTNKIMKNNRLKSGLSSTSKNSKPKSRKRYK